MSGTTTPQAAAFSASPFSDAEKADIRRFCGFPPYGAGPNGFQGWRFFQAYGTLEYRMNNLAPAEYQNVRYLLSLLYPIEMAIAGMFSTINVQVAAVFTRNPKELRDRKEQFNYQRFELCSVMGTPPGPQLNAQDGVRFVV